MPYYQTKPLTVEARQWDSGHSLAVIIDWLRNDNTPVLEDVSSVDGETLIEFLDADGMACVAYHGDWIVRTDSGFHVLEPHEFNERFEAAT